MKTQANEFDEILIDMICERKRDAIVDRPESEDANILVLGMSKEMWAHLIYPQQLAGVVVVLNPNLAAMEFYFRWIKEKVDSNECLG